MYNIQNLPSDINSIITGQKKGEKTKRLDTGMWKLDGTGSAHNLFHLRIFKARDTPSKCIV